MELAKRHKTYEHTYDYRIINRLPVIIRVDGRSFSKITRRLQRPYCPKLMNTMVKTMLHLTKQVDGAVFGYQQSDEITLVVKNDQTYDTEPFFGNRIQKLCSIIASIATLEFNRSLNGINLAGDAVFDCRVFAVPSEIEAVNNLIWRQEDCYRNAVTNALAAELINKYGKKTAASMLFNKNRSERLLLLKTECDINFDEKYDSSFRLGVGCYKTPKIIVTEHGQTTRNKWHIDYNLPKFIDNHEFISQIINSGRDVFRAERDLTEAGPCIIAPE